ncbi:endosulphine family protein [Pyrenophora tritici-repentis]|nr:Endosulfine domain-containing protein [Pyrenophora tritici-repentis]KAF7448255.1 Endosulfine domain containing protein [Pyrenophora tritici-repentis]KAG9384845.1 Endosulfine domain containing protein [Pyrenophora tritici-repentis]KAI0585550.1 Endosulfine domain-containing protein [Pyrenophora tritici-repentis]KAI0592662.1 Endosulfine domain-containing protein [Pyrenophora tritici-repentis]
MNPHQQNKVDISKMSEQEAKLFRLYGKLPNKKDLLQNKLKERKYFDSGDYALSKAGKAGDVGVTQTSLNRETSASDFENTEEPQATEGGAVKA